MSTVAGQFLFVLSSIGVIELAVVKSPIRVCQCRLGPGFLPTITVLTCSYT